MKKPMCISLRGGERIYVNGAVLSVDRKVTLELINDVAFLLQSPGHASRRRQYAAAPNCILSSQLMLMSPNDAEAAKSVYRIQRGALMTVAENTEILHGLDQLDDLVEAEKKYYDALRKIRSLFDIEQSILNGGEMREPVAVA